jgi:hypothetical protein
MTTRAVNWTSPKFPLIVHATAGPNAVAGGARHGGMLTIQQKACPGVFKVQMLPGSRIVTIVAAGGYVGRECSSMLIRMTTAAWLFLTPPE